MRTPESPVAETHGRGARIQLDLDGPKTIDRVLIMEDTRRGENVGEYVIEGLAFDKWRELARGAGIGEEKLDRFEPVAVLKVRLLITKSSARPIIRRLAAFAPKPGDSG
jgi:alpha-L-fucosidase